MNKLEADKALDFWANYGVCKPLFYPKIFQKPRGR